MTGERFPLPNGATLAITREGRTEYFFERGVAVLLRLPKEALAGAELTDKVVGKAAALLMVRGGIRSLAAGILSRPAAQVLERAHIPYTYERLTERIVNRTGDGLCPMESAVMHTFDAEEAYTLLLATQKQLRENAK